MPNKQQYYEPDAIDCNTVSYALRNDYSVSPDLTTTYNNDYVEVICRCRRVGGADNGVVQVQSLVRAALKSRRSLYVMQYSALLDCWHQLDRGVLGVAQTPIERSWQGRPIQPARSRK